MLYKNDHNQEIFYSPWRRTLRPLRGILHATFTFTMGAILFERLSTWAGTKEGKRKWKEAGLTARDLTRARFRCLEEIDSVRYSLEDLAHAGGQLKWLTAKGNQLVDRLAEAMGHVEQNMKKYDAAVSSLVIWSGSASPSRRTGWARETCGLT